GTERRQHRQGRVGEYWLPGAARRGPACHRLLRGRGRADERLRSGARGGGWLRGGLLVGWSRGHSGGRQHDQGGPEGEASVQGVVFHGVVRSPPAAVAARPGGKIGKCKRAGRAAASARPLYYTRSGAEGKQVAHHGTHFRGTAAGPAPVSRPAGARTHRGK